MTQKINEVNQPKSPADKKFKSNSIGGKTKDANGNGDDVFNAAKVAHKIDDKHGNTDCYKSKEKYDFGQSAGLEESRFRVITTNPSGKKSVRLVEAPSAQHARRHFLRMGHHVHQVTMAEGIEEVLEQYRTQISDRFEKLIKAQPKGAEVTFKHDKTGKTHKATYFSAADAAAGVKEMKKRGHSVVAKRLVESNLVEVVNEGSNKYKVGSETVIKAVGHTFNRRRDAAEAIGSKIGQNVIDDAKHRAGSKTNKLVNDANVKRQKLMKAISPSLNKTLMVAHMNSDNETLEKYKPQLNLQKKYFSADNKVISHRNKTIDKASRRVSKILAKHYPNVAEETLVEVSKEKLGDYVQAAAKDLHDTGRKRGMSGNTPELRRKTFNRNIGIQRAIEKLKGSK